MSSGLPPAATLPRAGRFGQGYHVGEVDDFLSRCRAAYESRSGAVTASQVRTVGFRLVRHGYAVEAVDALLDRLEDAFAAAESRVVGAAAAEREAEVADLIRRLSRVVDRADGDRFPVPRGRQRGYRQEDVDALCRRLAGVLHDGVLPDGVLPDGVLPDGVLPDGVLPDGGRNVVAGGGKLEVDDLRCAVFRPARAGRAYREVPVDAFWDRAVELLLMLRC